MGEEEKNNVQANSGEAQGQSQAEEKQPRELFYERVKSSRPDGKYDEDEQEVYRQASGWIDELEKNGKRGKEFQEKLLNRFQDAPDEAQAILDYADGMPLVAAIRKNMGEEALRMQEGSEGWDEYQKAGADRKAHFDEQQALINEIRENGIQSEADFEAFAEELGLTDEQKQAIWDLINEDLVNLSKGKITKDIMGRYRNALNHDSDVEGAHEQGKVEGKNEAIEAKKAKMAGSGLPNGSAGGNANEEIEDNPRAELAKQFARFRRG